MDTLSNRRVLTLESKAKIDYDDYASLQGAYLRKFGWKNASFRFGQYFMDKFPNLSCSEIYYAENKDVIDLIFQYFEVT